jgi:pimeloyl-ACP methyl ester carboxylesterase
VHVQDFLADFGKQKLLKLRNHICSSGVIQMKRIRYFFSAIVSATLFASCAAPSKQNQTQESQTMKSGSAPINGIKMYYEIHGSGDGIPLVLLNGGGSTIDVTYSKVIPVFARHRTVIALEEQGHGRTTDRPQPFRAETSADDVSALLKYLKIDRADVMGFSNGAGVAMQVAIHHPDQIRKLVFVSYMTNRKGAYPWLWEAMKKADFAGMPQPLKDAFLKVNPDPQKLRMMCDKDIERMQKFTDVPEKDVKSIHASTLILIGDKDVTQPEHAVELTHTIPNSRLIILPGGHGEFLGELLTGKPESHAPEYTAGLIEEFLNQ